MKPSTLRDKSIAFAIRIVKLCQRLQSEKEFVLSKQILSAGTSIAANDHEAQFAQSKADFISKLSIALKEASETQYWLLLLSKSDYITPTEYESLQADCSELKAMLISSIKTAKRNMRMKLGMLLMLFLLFLSLLL